MPKQGRVDIIPAPIPTKMEAGLAMKRFANQAAMFERKSARRKAKGLPGPGIVGVPSLRVDKPFVRPRPTPSFRPTPGPMPSPGGSVGPAKPKGPTEGYPEKPQGGGNKNYKGQRRTPPTYDY